MADQKFEEFLQSLDELGEQKDTIKKTGNFEFDSFMEELDDLDDLKYNNPEEEILRDVFKNKPEIVDYYFKEKSKLSIPKGFAKNILVIQFIYKKRSDDIIYGQIKRATNSIESQLNKEGFNVLRNDSLAYGENIAGLIFLLESITISKNEIRTGC